MRLSADGQVSTGHTHALDTHRPHRHSTATKESGVAGGRRTDNGSGATFILMGRIFARCEKEGGANMYKHVFVGVIVYIVN